MALTVLHRTSCHPSPFSGIVFYFSLSCIFHSITTIFAKNDQPADVSTLQLVQLLYRHGDRSPVAEFPSDPNPGMWPQGLGQLTKIGKMQQYKLGEFLRKRYLSGFMSSSYDSDQIVVRSTDRDRTLMSAYANLAGLYPPSEQEKWNPNLNWQPIPVHTVPKDEDQLLYMMSKCPKYMELYANFRESDYYKDFLDQKRTWVDFVSQKSGVEPEIEAISSVFDNLYCKTHHNMSLPIWANATVMKELKEMHDFKMEAYFHLPEMNILKGGVLLDEILKNTLLKVTEPDVLRKMYMYSAHDSTLVAFMMSLNVYNHLLVPYAACVMVELHKKADNSHFVQILYKNSTTDETLHILPIPGCEAKCPWKTFHSLTKESAARDIETQCTIKDTSFVTTSIVVVILLILLLIILVSGLICSRKCMNQLPYLPQGV